MTDMITPTPAYDLLDSYERTVVDDYVSYAISEQNRKRERIIEALYLPIPSEYIKRSRNALYKPILLAAISEKIHEAADAQDLSPSRVIAEHAAIAFSNIADFIIEQEFGSFRVRDLNTISRSKMQAVKSIETKPGAFGLHTKIVMHDKHPSLKAMGEMMGLIAPDRPPPLEEYVKPMKTVNEKTVLAPEKEYTELLATIGG